MRVIAVLAVLALCSSSAQKQEVKPSENLHTRDEAHVSVVLHGPQVIKAGETIDLVLTISPPVNFEGAMIQVNVTGPNNMGFGRGVWLQPGVTVYHLPLKIPPAAQGGSWAVDKLTFYSGGNAGTELPFKNYTFEVIANKGLVYPMSADIGVNPSQIQLLRTEAVRVQTRIRDLKAQLAEHARDRDLVAVLSRSIQESLTALQTTSTQFHALSTDPQQSSASRIFFDDLRLSYNDAARELGHAALLQGNRPVASVSFEPQMQKLPSQSYPLISQGVLRALEQNELAYTLVADTESLTFDLVLTSAPQGAATALRRRGDEFQNSGQMTDCTIKGLPKAIWFVRFEKTGYKPEEREHDPFREPNHVVNVVLTKR